MGERETKNEADKKMRLKKYFLALAVMLFLLFLTSSMAEAASIGASPANVYFTNMLRDGYAEGFVTVSVADDQPITVTASAGGEIAEWLEFPSNFSVSRSRPYRMKIIAKPPADVANGVYPGSIKFTATSPATVEGQIGSAVQASVIIGLNVGITDEQFVSCKIGSASANNAEQGSPVSFSYSMLNEGNVRLRPSISINIWDQEQENIVKTSSQRGDEVLPTVRQTNSVQFSTEDLPLGQYWVDFSVDECHFSELLTFDVVEKGAIMTKGFLHGIFNEAWVEVGDTVPISALFENVGEGVILAKFKGNVQLNERVVSLLESDELFVEPGEKINLAMFYTPKNAGRHIIEGRVFYANKRTFEKFSVLNVQGKKMYYVLVLLYTAIVVLILFIIYKIYTRRRYY